MGWVFDLSLNNQKLDQAWNNSVHNLSWRDELLKQDMLSCHINSVNCMVELVEASIYTGITTGRKFDPHFMAMAQKCKNKWASEYTHVLILIIYLSQTNVIWVSVLVIATWLTLAETRVYHLILVLLTFGKLRLVDLIVTNKWNRHKLQMRRENWSRARVILCESRYQGVANQDMRPMLLLLSMPT